MPLYEYECDACGERFEVIQKSFSSPPPEACEKCGRGPVHRMQSSPAIQFKGSGFYITDYAKKGSSEAGESKGKSDSSKTESTGDSKTSTAKTDSAATKDSSTKGDAPAASTSPASTTPASTKKD
jgi:putative FmdB family regulatory protein